MNQTHTAPLGQTSGGKSMLKTLGAQLKQYKKDVVITPLLSVLEGILETLIPFVMADIYRQRHRGGGYGRDLEVRRRHRLSGARQPDLRRDGGTLFRARIHRLCVQSARGDV